MTTNSPKDFLSGHELIGFKQGPKGEEQVPRRASSAKVTTIEPTWPAKRGGAKRRREKSCA